MKKWPELDQELIPDCKKVMERLKSKLGDRLISLILYGSAARGELKAHSDLDFYIFSDGLPQEAVERSIFLRKLLVGINTSRRVTLRGKESSELIEIYPLFLDLAFDGILLYDHRGFAQNYLEKIRKKIEKAHLQRYHTEDGFYGWKAKKPLRKGERIILEFKEGELA